MIVDREAIPDPGDKLLHGTLQSEPLELDRHQLVARHDRLVLLRAMKRRDVNIPTCHSPGTSGPRPVFVDLKMRGSNSGL